MTSNKKIITLFTIMSLTQMPTVVHSASSLSLLRYHSKAGIQYKLDVEAVSAPTTKNYESHSVATSEQSDFFNEYSRALHSSSYGTWDASMSLSMSMSMPVTANSLETTYPSTPSMVAGDIMTPPPSFIVGSSIKNTPTYSPGVRKSNTPTVSLVNRTDEANIFTINPSPDDIFRNNTVANLNSNSQNEKTFTKLTPVGVTFLALSLVVIGTVVGTLVIRRRHRRQLRGIKL